MEVPCFRHIGSAAHATKSIEPEMVPQLEPQVCSRRYNRPFAAAVCFYTDPGEQWHQPSRYLVLYVLGADDRI
jgi:hypothetical protein